MDTWFCAQQCPQVLRVFATLQDAVNIFYVSITWFILKHGIVYILASKVMVSLNADFSRVCLVTDRHYELVKIKSKLFAFETKYHGTKVQYVYLLGMI